MALERRALKALPARTFGILMSLEPAVAALVGLAFLREVLSATQWLAVALVIAASAASTLMSRRTPEPHEGDAGEGRGSVPGQSKGSEKATALP